MKSLPICVSLTRDGTPCGRRASPGNLVCHIHLAQQSGKAVGALTQPAPFDAQQKLLKIAANDKHPHQLQALRLLREREECQGCKARIDSEEESGVLPRAANPEQRTRLSALLTSMRDWKADVRASIAANPV